MNRILKKALLTVTLIVAASLSAQASESLRIVSAANPSGDPQCSGDHAAAG